MRSWFAIILVLTIFPAGVRAGEEVLTSRMHHLRIGTEPEWSDFPRETDGTRLQLRFRAGPNAGEWTLRLRQQDVKQTWKVLLNGKELGRLEVDENDMVVNLPIPRTALGEGENTLLIEQAGKVSDDIRVGEIALDSRPVREVLSEATVDISVRDAGQSEKPTPLPCRLTVLDARGALATVWAKSGGHLAVRPGVIYTGTGQARFGLPAGEYTVYAGRGFEYGIDSVRVAVRPGDTLRKTLSIRREVPTEGYVSCDTHVHTLTYSGHGDSTADERVLTIAGEGIELPIITEHDRQVDYSAAAVKHDVRRYFTPVVGNEVTTGVGHFNIFPVPAGDQVPDFKLKDWKPLFESIRATGAKVVILNHGRDLHRGFRPFGPERHLALTGENLDGWVLQTNGMEVVNSGAQQTDLMRLVRDWFGLLNRGFHLTPVGSSDSHDVSRYIVGQGRTYIRARDDRPAEIDVAEAVENFRKGRVLVSCGLLADITVNDKYGPGDLVPVQDKMKVAVRVLGPGWVKADRVELYANGIKVQEARIPEGQKPGVKWEGIWTLPRFKHDVHLAAVASGPGVRELYWPIGKPYQPTSPMVDRRVIGLTGAVWLDGDGDGKKTSAHDQARRLFDAAWPRSAELVQALADHDEAVAVQTASLLQGKGVAASDPAIREAARKAGPQVERAFQAFAEAWRESQLARAKPR